MKRKTCHCLVGMTIVMLTWLMQGGVALAVKEAKPFGIAGFAMGPTQTIERTEGGAPVFENKPYSFTQAGGHPAGLTATVLFASEEIEEKSGLQGVREIVPTRDPRDVVVDLPPGLLGNPMAVPRCSLKLL